MGIPNIPVRKSPRLKGYDYSSVGVYHVVVCAKNKAHVFGEIESAVVRLNPLGEIADRNARAIDSHFPEAALHVHVVMPNHVHLLIGIGTREDSDTNAARHTLGGIVAAYKASVSREAHCSVWQPRFYDRVIRNDDDYLGVWEYIQNNPSKWDTDEFYS